jgi:myosin heavy subunit
MQAPDLMKALIKPRIRVGNEYVQQGRNQEQVSPVPSWFDHSIPVSVIH